MKKPKIKLVDRFHMVDEVSGPRGPRRVKEFLDSKENRCRVFATRDLRDALGYSESHFKTAIGAHPDVQCYRLQIAYHRYVWGNSKVLKQFKEERGW